MVKVKSEYSFFYSIFRQAQELADRKAIQVDSLAVSMIAMLAPVLSVLLKHRRAILKSVLISKDPVQRVQMCSLTMYTIFMVTSFCHYMILFVHFFLAIFKCCLMLCIKCGLHFVVALINLT